ncbi:MAG TPA: DUF542 domain-containing protein [Thermoanaerobaculia bacterium]|nr:DUF542 domain-containing protein [Thermoanaerobaculia bacterium]
MTNSLFDPKLPVKVLLERSAPARAVLAAYGLDTCCGGEHPLEMACSAKNVPLAKVLEDLESAHHVAESYSLVPPTMTVREVRRRFPSTAPVLERYGLGDCGGEEGPEEPLAWFATVHRLPLEEFLRDVREAAARDAANAPRVATPASAAAPFSPHFVLGSLVLTLTLGATTGMINLLRIAAGAEVAISHRQIHGHAQVLGFAALFLMGIAYHALPRILGVGGLRPKSARPAFWLMFSGVILRNAGQPLGFYAAGRLLSLLSSAAEAASVFLFARFVFALLARVRAGKYDPSDPILRFVRAGTIFFGVAILFNAAQGIWLAGHRETALPVSLTEPFYFAALYGFLLAWIYGFGNRVVSLFLGLGPAARRTPEITLWLLASGVPVFLASSLPGLPPGAAVALRDAGLALASLSAVVYLAGNGFLWRRASLPVMKAPGAPTVAIRCAFGCLGLWAILELSAVVVSRATSIPAMNLWWSDAARHLFTVGFLTLLIVGMSLRILPVFSGKPLWSPRLAYATYALLLGGAAMRLLQYPAAWNPLFYRIGAFMGVPVVVAILLFAFNLVKTMKTQRPASVPATPTRSAPTFASTLPVR